MNELTGQTRLITARNGTLLRRQNLRTAIEIVRRRHPIAQTDIVRKTGLRASTVSYLVHELQSNGLVEVVGRGTVGPGGGKPSVMLAPVSNAATFLGVLVSREHLASAYMDFAGVMSGYELEPITPHGAGLVTDQIARHVQDRRDQLGLKAAHGLSGVGIAIASVVDHTGKVAASADFEIDLGHLAKALNRAIPQCPPVSVENDANCTALFAEHQDPKHRSSTLALVFTDHPSSVGAGLCINGRIYRGFNGSAGELLPTRSSQGYRSDWEDSITSTAVRFIDPEVVVLAATGGRRKGFNDDHPQLRLELANRRVQSVDANPAAANGAAQLAYQNTVSSLIDGGHTEG